jgi:hypothetical protein
MTGPETVCFSCSQFRIGVEALHNTGGKLLFGAETSRQQGAMPSQHPGYILHRLKLRSHGLGAQKNRPGFATRPFKYCCSASAGQANITDLPLV